MIHYLNTDLDLVAADDLSLLANTFEQNTMFCLHVEQREDGLWYASFETNQTFAEPGQNIAEMLTTIESLGEPEISTWSACMVREFNIGYECGDEPWAFNQVITDQTLERIAEVGASLRITLYPPPSETK